MMQTEIGNQEKLEYLHRYDPLNDYFTSVQYKVDKEFINKTVDLSEFDLQKLQKNLTKLNVEGEFENQIIDKQTISQYINDGFNILVYGYGSKIELLDQILEEIASQLPSIFIFVVKGYKPQVNLKIFLQHMIETLKPYLGKKKDVTLKKEDQILEYLKKYLDQRVLIVIHSIDGKHLLNKQSQQIIENLSQIAYINIIGSFDNYRYTSKMHNCIYYCCHTYRPYINELKQLYEDQLGKQKQEEGIWYILASLTERQKEIALQLANQIVTNNKEGLDLQELYNVCLEEMIVSSKEQLRENLKELIEHNVVELKKDQYRMNYSLGILKQLAQKIQQQL